MTRAVYDAMVFFQWATLPPHQPERQHATVTATAEAEEFRKLAPQLKIVAPKDLAERLKTK